MDTALLGRIKKLLALADPARNPNAEEAQAALIKARALMAEHGIQEAKVMGADSRQTETVVEKAVGGGYDDVEPWEHWITVVIAGAFRCRAYHTRTRYGVEVRIFGRPQDVEVAATAILTMRMAAHHCYDRWAQTLGRRVKAAERLGYLRGFVDGLRRAIDDQNRQHPEWAIVLATPQVVVSYGRDVLHLVPGKPLKARMDDRGRQQGWRDGYDAWRRNTIPD